MNPATPNQNFAQQSQQTQHPPQAQTPQQQQQQQSFTPMGNFSPNSQANFQNQNSGNGQPGYPQVSDSSPLASHNSSGYPGQEQYGGQEQQWQHHDDQVIWGEQDQQIKMESGYNNHDQQNNYMQQEVNNSPNKMDSIHSEVKAFSQADKVNLNTRIKTMILNKQQENKMDDSKAVEQNTTGHFLSYSHHQHLNRNLSVDGGTSTKPDFDKNNLNLDYLKTDHFAHGYGNRDYKNAVLNFGHVAAAKEHPIKSLSHCQNIHEQSKAKFAFPMPSKSPNMYNRNYMPQTLPDRNSLKSSPVSPFPHNFCSPRTPEPKSPRHNQRSNSPYAHFQRSPSSTSPSSPVPHRLEQLTAVNLNLKNSPRYGGRQSPLNMALRPPVEQQEMYQQNNQASVIQSTHQPTHFNSELSGRKSPFVRRDQLVHTNVQQLHVSRNIPTNISVQSSNMRSIAQGVVQNADSRREYQQQKMFHQQQQFLQQRMLSQQQILHDMKTPKEKSSYNQQILHYEEPRKIKEEVQPTNLCAQPNFQNSSNLLDEKPLVPASYANMHSSVTTKELITQASLVIPERSPANQQNFVELKSPIPTPDSVFSPSRNCTTPVSRYQSDQSQSSGQSSYKDYDLSHSDQSQSSKDYDSPQDQLSFPSENLQGVPNECNSAVIENKHLPQYHNQYASKSLPKVKKKLFVHATPSSVKTTSPKLKNTFPTLSEKQNKHLGMEIPDCKCFPPNQAPPEPGTYYTHLGCASSLKSLRHDLECRTGVAGSAIRIEKVRYTGKEGKTAQGCPIAKWVSSICC